jgi:hypothetical protein
MKTRATGVSRRRNVPAGQTLGDGFIGLLTALILLLAAPLLRAAAGDGLFTNAAVRHVEITIARTNVAALRSSARKAVPAMIREGGRNWERVGVHLKGATGSFRGIDDKPSFTLTFDRYDSTQRFHGFTKIHLNNAVEDPSFMSEWLGSELFRAAGVPAARVTHATVELNGRNLGLFVLVEGLTEEFLAGHFRRTDGHLYEPGPGNDVDEEMDEKTGRRPRHQGDLKALSLALAETNAAVRWTGIEARLDTPRFISFMALEMMLAHRDGYCLARNNFRIYHDMDAGRMVFLPHGMDQLFGAAPLTLRPRMNGLVARTVLAAPEGLAQYRARTGVLYSNVLDLAAIEKRIDARAALLRRETGLLARGAYDREAAAFKARVATRHAQVGEMLRKPEPSPLDLRGGPVTLSNWRAVDAAPGGVIDQSKSPDGKGALHIRAGGNTGASWRTSVLLAPGAYRFEAPARTAGVAPLPYGQKHGAALKAGSGGRSEPLEGDRTWTVLRVEFKVAEAQEIELACELRASAGEVWFDLGSLRLSRAGDE